jgi:hypothetical protein
VQVEVSRPVLNPYDYEVNTCFQSLLSNATCTATTSAGIRLFNKVLEGAARVADQEVFHECWEVGLSLPGVRLVTWRMPAVRSAYRLS